MRYYSYSFLLPLFPPLCLCSDPSLVLTQKDWKKRSACTYCQPHTPLSLSHSAATKGLGWHFPEVIISQHVSQPILISARTPNHTGIFPAQAGLQLFPLFHHRQKNNGWMYLKCNTSSSGGGGKKETLRVGGAYPLGLKTQLCGTLIRL